MRQMITNTYSAIPPDTATLNRALGEVAIPVLIENPFTPGLYSLITSVDNYVRCRDTSQRLQIQTYFLQGERKRGEGDMLQL